MCGCLLYKTCVLWYKVVPKTDPADVNNGPRDTPRNILKDWTQADLKWQ